MRAWIHTTLGTILGIGGTVTALNTDMIDTLLSASHSHSVVQQASHGEQMRIDGIAYVCEAKD